MKKAFPLINEKRLFYLQVPAFTASHIQNCECPVSGFQSSCAGPVSFFYVPATFWRFLQVVLLGLSDKHLH